VCRENPEDQIFPKEFYLGLSDLGKKKSFKDAKRYNRRERWFS